MAAGVAAPACAGAAAGDAWPAAAGGAIPPGEGGATPIIVAFINGFCAGLGAGAGTAGPALAIVPGFGGLADTEVEGGRGAVGGALTINIVPLNLGAVAPFKLKAHFWQAAALSSFCVPQFGQNTSIPPVVPVRSIGRQEE